MAQLIAQLLAVEVVILLLLRPVIWWYFGITRALRALESMDASLRCLPAVRSERERLRRVG